MIRIKHAGEFDQLLDVIAKNDLEMFDLVNAKIKLFKKNPNDTRLDNHPLKRRMRGKWAFSITEDIRIVYIWQGEKRVRFLNIGPHSKVYSRAD
ncbi:hypothetical protein A2630_03255 [Candidatus Woesebacteria bacterium RIFCSPHIGHO2_01_FULL_44_10]|nr:MAG: hypothetical protein A2630_03255 [Candidatus Woesebacteria bacterium RIFCSPHIGHO2_01_FULL_44_10]